MPGMLELKEDDTYYYDAEAGDRPCRFIEKYAQHFQGVLVGKPFLLAPVQKQIIRDVYGWKRRADGYRRFTNVWWEAAVGAGKSPLLSMLGIYGLAFDGEAGAEVFSIAGTYQQAQTVFNAAKNYIDQSPALKARLDTIDRVIRHKASRSEWRILSGTPKAGARPSLILADEIHEFRNRKVFDSLVSRTSKRAQPLVWCATNTGDSHQSLYYQLHEQAVKTLNGDGPDNLYPVIWAAEPEAAIDDKAGWIAANPLIGVTITEAAVKEKSETMEAHEFRRLYLSQLVQSNSKWLDIAQWDGCTAAFNPDDLKGEALFVGADLADCDDLCALTYSWMTPEKTYVSSHFWIPSVTAEKYEKLGIPYGAWVESGDITLTDGPTVSDAVKLEIANHVIAMSKSHKVKAVCFDRYKADAFVAALENAGITCVAVPQGYSVSPGCAFLERKLKEEAMVIQPNKVLRACAEQVEVVSDRHGNRWVVKPGGGQGTGYQGKREIKVDGIAALVTSLVEARKHNFPKKAVVTGARIITRKK